MRIKLLFYYIGEFLLSVLVLILFLIALLECTVLRPKYILDQFEKNNYYEVLYKSINNEMSNYIIQAGLEDPVLDNIYTKNMIKKEVTNMVKRFYGGSNVKVDTEIVKENLENNISSYLAKNNIEITDQKALDQFIEQMLDIYEEKIVLSKSLMKVQNIVVKSDFALKIIFMVLTVITCALGILVKYICKKRVIAVPLFTTGILLLLGNYLLFNRIDVWHILFWNENVSNIIKSILFNLSSLVQEGAILLMILSIVSCFIFRKREKKDN